MSGMGESEVELTLEILLGDLKILQGHVRALVTEELYDGSKVHAGSQHFSPVCVSKLVRDDAGGNSDRRHDFLECSAEPTNQHVTAARSRQKQTTSFGRSLRTQRTDPFDQLTDRGIHRNPAFRFELAQRHMDGPLVGAERAQTIHGEIDTFADAHAGVTQEQQDITSQVIAAQQFLLDQLILLRSQRTRQTVFLAGDIVTTEQMSKSRELLGPCEFFQHASQVDDVVRARDRGQWRVVGSQESQPTEDMGIAAQLIERVNLRVLSGEISQKMANCSTIRGDGRITQGGNSSSTRVDFSGQISPNRLPYGG